jgi:hypothetical protein
MKIKVMKGLDKIQKEAKVLVDTLWGLELDSITVMCDKFIATGLNLEPQYFYDSLDKYMFSFCSVWDNDSNEYVTPNWNDYSDNKRYEMMNGHTQIERTRQIIINLMAREGQYRERNLERMEDSFRAANTSKLNRALAKHITNEMEATEIVVTTGDVGCEVLAIIDGDKLFKTKGKLCGGYIQTYHYRYFSSLTDKK